MVKKSDGITILEAAIQSNKPFRCGSLVFQPSDAEAALEFAGQLSGRARAWFDAQTPMRMVFLGQGDKQPIPETPRELRKKGKETEDECCEA